MKNKWIVHGTKNENAEVELILFTYAGGSPSVFAPWKKLFSSSVNIDPVLYPGRELRKNEPMPENVRELVKSFVEENEELFSGSFAFFGHCTGAFIAYETARYVQEKYRRSPVAFIASGSDSPGITDLTSILKDENGCEVSDEELAHRMVKIGIVTPDFVKDSNFINYYMPIYRNDLLMLGRSDASSRDKLDCDIYTLHGDEDDFITENGQQDWKNYTTGTLYSDTCPGGHFYITSRKEMTVEKLEKAIINSMKGRGKTNG